jgi:hypothetical protein
MDPMFDAAQPGSLGLLLLVAGISGMLLGGVLVVRRMAGERSPGSFRATDRRGTLDRAAHLAAEGLPWLLGLVLAGSLLWVAAIALRLVPA